MSLKKTEEVKLKALSPNSKQKVKKFPAPVAQNILSNKAPAWELVDDKYKFEDGKLTISTGKGTNQGTSSPGGS